MKYHKTQLIALSTLFIIFSRCIDLIGKDMIRRLDLTAEYIDLLNKIEVLNEKFNYVKK